MAFTPTDPTKAEVRVVGTGANQTLDFYFPQGPKGDPGGFNAATVLGSSVNLDDIKIPGLYRQTTATSATALNNYPLTSSGALVVYEAANTGEVIQSFMPYGGGSAAVVRSIFWRRYFGGAWSSWISYSSTRFDHTAGRVMYQWDHLNNREQLIFGDTGWRSLTPANGWTATQIMLRRDGRTVFLHALNITGGSATSDAVTEVLPVGFRSNNFAVSVRVPVVTGTNIDTTRVAAVDITTQALRVFGAAYSSLTTPSSITSIYETNDPWPTTLPGSASGSIPNT